ncbi:class I SAM-dependent methyltransferase [Vibrio sp. TRT 21S02]|uniref:class I SAM-dependent methyltransferase n=1 Tax=Vibrio sp. TRT 21S02 TaxID=3418507 RepID=UPI003CF528CE
MVENKDILSEVKNYYDKKLSLYGNTSQGVDWNSVESQVLRFEQLTKVIRCCKKTSLNDLGCGHGDYYYYLTNNFDKIEYEGIDVSQDMVDLAHDKFPEADFICSSKPSKIRDYTIASGIFNVRQSRSDDEWWAYFTRTLDIMDSHSELGFAFNCLTSFSDIEKRKAYLYYADPMKVFEYCKKKYSRNVALLHDYDLYEFTIIIRKDK